SSYCPNLRGQLYPTDLQVLLADGRSVDAKVYIYEGVNPLGSTISTAKKAEMILKARGTSGSALDYVRRNFEGLHDVGLEDPAVTELWQAVQALRG
ncbi:gamma-glutamylcyclotransferase, partial [Bradyrhizobium japonicum]|uniref:gamma-glutamylcyclotransferase n=3 Tax=Bradyrhizobium japonicum TaxID=375 RepID=UPI0018721A10